MAVVELGRADPDLDVERALGLVVVPGQDAVLHLDHDPAPSPQTNTGLDVNPALYDTLGRIYRAGVRFNF